MNRILVVAAAVAVLATPSLATEGLPGATVRTDSGKSAAERKARFEQWCNENPEKCREAKANAQRRREECKANPEKCRAEAQKGMPLVARNFEQIDANKDGSVTLEEIAAARKVRAGTGKGKAN